MDLQLCAGLSALETFVLVGRARLLLEPSTIKLWLALLFTQFLVLKIYRIIIYPHYLSPLRHLPGPKDNLFLVGQELRILQAPSPNDLFESWARTWPRAPFIRYVGWFGTENLLVNSVGAYKDHLTTYCYDFVKAPIFEAIGRDMVPGGLLWGKGDEHKRQRRLLNGPFSLVKARTLVPVYQAEARKFVEALGRAADENDDGVVRVDPLISRVCLDTIGVTAMGIDLESLPTNDFYEHYEVMVHPTPLAGLLLFLNAALVPLRWLPIEENRAFKTACKVVHGTLRGVIKDRIEELSSKGEKETGLEAGKSERRDLLTFMLEESMPGKNGLTEQQIAENLFQFIVGGHDTTACALTHAFFILATMPEVQDRLRNEVLAAAAGSNGLDAAALEGMKYLNNFLREVLRLYPSGVTSPRMSTKDLVIQGVAIPKNTTVILAYAAINKNPAIWGGDADKFDPDRWTRLEGTEASSPYAFETFTNGPRICPGRQQAMLEMKAIVAELLMAFELEPATTHFTYDNPCVNLRIKGGLEVKLRRRV